MKKPSKFQFWFKIKEFKLIKKKIKIKNLIIDESYINKFRIYVIKSWTMNLLKGRKD